MSKVGSNNPLKYGRRHVHSRKFSRTAIDRAQLFLLFAVPGCRRDAVTHEVTTFLGGNFYLPIQLRSHLRHSLEASLDSRATASAGLRRYVHGQPAFSGRSICHRGSGNAPCRARLSPGSSRRPASWLHKGAGSGDGLAMMPTSLYQPPVRPHDARARARISSCITRFDQFRLH